MHKLVYYFNEIKSADVYRIVLWMLAEYYPEPFEAVDTILNSIGQLPLIHTKEEKMNE